LYGSITLKIVLILSYNIPGMVSEHLIGDRETELIETGWRIDSHLNLPNSHRFSLKYIIFWDWFECTKKGNLISTDQEIILGVKRVNEVYWVETGDPLWIRHTLKRCVNGNWRIEVGVKLIHCGIIHEF